MATPPAGGITIREANDDDVTAISELGTHVFALTFGYSVEPHELQAYLDEAYSVKAIAKDTSDPKKDTLVATNSKDEVVGFVLLAQGITEPCVSHLDSQIKLQRLYVHPSLHGHGVGRLLSSAAEDLARLKGFKYAWLGVWEDNVKAQKVYQKMGYTQVGSHDFDIGGNIQTDHIMLKELSTK